MTAIATVQRRLAALEAGHGGNKCPECGFGRNESPPWEVQIARPGEPTESDRWCGECGRKLLHNVNLRWD
jgi:hypothetical protein